MRCDYCGEYDYFDIEEDTLKEYCMACGHYTGRVYEHENYYSEK